MKKYGILPANAVDISFIQSFWMKYFGDAYYKKDQSGRISMMVRGIRIPVDGYVFTIETSNNETESDLTQAEFDLRAQGYIKLSYTGVRTSIRPIEMPQLLKKEVTIPQQTQEQIKEKEQSVIKKKERIKKEVKEKDTGEKDLKDEESNQNDEAVVSDDKDVEPSSDTVVLPPKKRIGRAFKAPKEEDNGAVDDTAADAAPGGDEFKDEINKIRER